MCPTSPHLPPPAFGSGLLCGWLQLQPSPSLRTQSWAGRPALGRLLLASPRGGHKEVCEPRRWPAAVQRPHPITPRAPGTPALPGPHLTEGFPGSLEAPGTPSKTPRTWEVPLPA